MRRGAFIGPDGGIADRFRFAVFGDVRPPNADMPETYPTAIIQHIVTNFTGLNAQFAVATGDYMFANTTESAEAQVALLLTAEHAFGGTVFHSLGNHECLTNTLGNCPNGVESANIQVFHSRLASAYANVYFDWTVRTSSGDAHFIAAAPNAWSVAQESWLTAALAQPARYTFVISHIPPSSQRAPASVRTIEDAINARPGGVTLRLYGHTHEYRKLATNAVIVGNGGAPLGGSGNYGFVMVDQRADGDVSVVAYEIGNPPLLRDAFVVHPDGTAH